MTNQADLWVVYSMTLPGQAAPTNVVCQHDEWDAINLRNPGKNQLIKEGVASEGEAEMIARGTSGDSPKRKHKVKVTPFARAPLDLEPSK